MEEQVISFDTAKLAKEKGFNWKPIHVYSTYNTVHEIKTKPTIKLVRQRSQRINTVPAPTQSLLQKWLREKYDIIVLVIITSTLDMECHIYNKDTDRPICCGFLHKDYEGILDEGLIEALKLILPVNE